MKPEVLLLSCICMCWGYQCCIPLYDFSIGFCNCFFFIKIASFSIVLPVFNRVRVTRSLALCVCFVDRCLSFCTFSLEHCVVCSFSIYGFRFIPLCDFKLFFIEPSHSTLHNSYNVLSIYIAANCMR